MYNNSLQVFKNKYTHELTRLLLVKLPSCNGRAFGLTGNLLPVIVLVRSRRKFSKMSGWYYTMYAVTNKYAKLTERMNLSPVDSDIISRLWYRLKTIEIDEIQLRSVNLDNDYYYYYVTVINHDTESLFLFYINNKKKGLIKAMDKDIYAKPFIFRRFKRTIVNLVTDDVHVAQFIMSNYYV